MRVALLAPLVTPLEEPQHGGSQSLVVDLYKGLKAKGIDCDLFASRDSRLEFTFLPVDVDTARARSAMIHPAQSEHSRSVHLDHAFQEVAEMLRSDSYDVVHNHAFDPGAIEALARLQSPVIHTLHLPPTLPMMEAITSLRNRKTSFVCVSESQKKQWDLLPSSNVIHNGVDIERIPFGGKKEDWLLYAGRFSPEKGVEDAIEIAHRSGHSIKLIGSPYDPDYVQELRAAYPGVLLEEPMERSALWRVMSKAKGLLLPVKWDEPFGLVAVEAQAAGTPVIAYERGALGEVIADNVSGFLVEPGDIDAATRAVAMLSSIAPPDCRRHAESHFSLEKMIERYLALYRAVQSVAKV